MAHTSQNIIYIFLSHDLLVVGGLKPRLGFGFVALKGIPYGIMHITVMKYKRSSM